MPENVRCIRCGQAKPADEFAWKHRERGRRNSYCRPCQADYGREHYLANKQRYIDQAAARSREIRIERTRELLAYFDDHPCADCGESDPLVLDFDHLRDKRFAVAGALVDRPWKVILAEMEKCDVVCANCHRRRTFARKPSVRLVLAEATKRAAGIEPVSFSLEG